jgi:hypothetical protein
MEAGTEIARLRKAHDWTQEALADRLFVSKASFPNGRRGSGVRITARSSGSRICSACPRTVFWERNSLCLTNFLAASRTETG